MTFLQKIGAGYHQLQDDFLLKKVLNDIEPVEISSSDKLFIFSHRTSAYYLKLYTLLAHALSKKGYPSCFLFRDCLIDRYLPNVENISEKIDISNILSIKSYEVGSYLPRLIINGKEISNSLIEKISNVEITDCSNWKLLYKWEIDFKKELVESNNINFFPLIHSTIRTIFKKYNINFSDKKVILNTKKMIKSCDLLLYYFLKLKQYSNENNLKIRIVGWEQNYISNGVFLILCNYFSKNRDIEYIDFARGYPGYFGHHHHESHILISNLTYSKKKDRLVINKKEFEALTQKYDIEKAFFEINKIIKKPVLRVLPEQQNVVNLIKDYASQKKKVFVIFTHLFYDTDLNDSSPSFKDMCDWIKETINFFKNNENLLLLKPHPCEVRPDAPQIEPNETLKSFLEKEKIKLTNNIVVLEPRLFSLNELISFIDCGLIWRSSAAMELTFYGIPSIICGCPPYEALDFNYVNNKKDYFNMMEIVDKLKVNKNLKINVARYLIGLKDRHKNVQIISYNKKVKRNYLEKNLINKYLINGDKNIDFFVNELLK